MDAGEAAEVLARAREGDEEAFGALVRQHSRRLFQVAFKITGNEQDAEDVVQESFLRAYRQLRRFEARANFSTWLYRIAVNCAVDLMRASRAQRRTDPLDETAGGHPADGPGPGRLAYSAEIQRSVEAALEELTTVERAAFVLRHCEGRSIKEICRILDVRTSAAKHGVFRAVRKLRTRLAPLRSATRASLE